MILIKDKAAVEELIKGLLDEVVREAEKLNIPVSKNIMGISINRRAKSRFGCCKEVKNILGRRAYQIEISECMLDCPDYLIKSVIAHEVIHTCSGCMNHGARWKSYAQKMRETYGYDIRTSSKYKAFGLEKPESREEVKYTIVCTKCGSVFYRKRKCKLVSNISRYRCGKCGGELKIQ